MSCKCIVCEFGFRLQFFDFLLEFPRKRRVDRQTRLGSSIRFALCTFGRLRGGSQSDCVTGQIDTGREPIVDLQFVSSHASPAPGEFCLFCLFYSFTLSSASLLPNINKLGLSHERICGREGWAWAGVGIIFNSCWHIPPLACRLFGSLPRQDRGASAGCDSRLFDRDASKTHFCFAWKRVFFADLLTCSLDWVSEAECELE